MPLHAGIQGLGGLPEAGIPCSIYQLPPHITFEEAEELLPSIAEDGYTGVQMGPTHSPSRENFDGKSGSAYAPRDHLRIGEPYYRPDVSLAQYFAGDFERDAPEVGWQAYAKMVSQAEALGLTLVQDMVLAHTARDPDVVARHEGLFGPEFYQRNAITGELTYQSAVNDGGEIDLWNDTAAVNFSGPAQHRILSHFAQVLERFILAGVTCFRLDAAPRIPINSWEHLIRGAQHFARINGRIPPSFYAETLDAKAGIDLQVRLVKDAGVRATTDSYFWWDLVEEWFYEQQERVRQAGGHRVTILSNHDTLPFAAKFHSFQKRLMRAALAASITSALTVMHGTAELSEEPPKKFLDKSAAANRWRLSEQQNARDFRAALRVLLRMKKSYSIFSSPAPTQVTYTGRSIRVIERKNETESVQIALNTGTKGEFFDVPEAYRSGLLFYANNNNNKDTKFWGTSDDMPYKTFPKFWLDPNGIAIFRTELP